MYANLTVGSKIGILLDYETRSPVDLGLHGSSVYSRHPDTEILCAVAADVYLTEKSVRVDTMNLRVWDGTMPMPPEYWPTNTEILFAFNAMFEVNIGVNLLGLKIRPKQVYCIQNHALYNGLPASLDDVSKAIPLKTPKDEQGARLMKKMCSPQKDGTYLDDTDKRIALIRYCCSDVLAEAELLSHPRTKPVAYHEMDCYQETLEINLRGIPVDTELARSAQKIVAKTVADIEKKIPGVNLRSHTQIKAFARQHGYVMESTDKEHVAKYLEDPKLPAPVEELLQAKALGIGSSSVSKYDSLLNFTDADGILRGSYRHHGAIRTGRWTSQGVQIQNLPRGEKHIIESEDFPAYRDMVKAGDYDGICMATDNRPMDMLRSTIRSSFAPGEGEVFVQRDLSAIEARGVLWVSGAKNLKIFEEFDKGVGEEPYMIFAKRLNSDRFMGKVGILSSGYGCGAPTFAAMCASYGREITESFAKATLDLYKEMFPEVPDFWKKVGSAAVKATECPGKICIVETPTNDIKFMHQHGNLLLKLPSERVLTYWGAKNKPGKFGPELTYMTHGSENGKQLGWHRTRTWGGALTGHIVQGFSACIMRGILLDLSKEGIPSCMTTHDEAVVIAKESEAKACYDKMGEIMKRVPVWAKGLPIQSSGWIESYFMKD